MRTNSLLPDPRDEAEIERLEKLLSELRKQVRRAGVSLMNGANYAAVAGELQSAYHASDPSRKES